MNAVNSIKEGIGITMYTSESEEIYNSQHGVIRVGKDKNKSPNFVHLPLLFLLFAHYSFVLMIAMRGRYGLT